MFWCKFILLSEKSENRPSLVESTGHNKKHEMDQEVA